MQPCKGGWPSWSLWSGARQRLSQPCTPKTNRQLPWGRTRRGVRWAATSLVAPSGSPMPQPALRLQAAKRRWSGVREALIPQIHFLRKPLAFLSLSMNCACPFPSLAHLLSLSLVLQLTFRSVSLQCPKAAVCVAPLVANTHPQLCLPSLVFLAHNSGNQL